MNHTPLISVIVPIYNVEKYLPTCINSVLNQTYSNLEIILVDDGSTDKCPYICDEFALKDNRIKVIHQENGGLSSARNIGIETSSGDYICFIDSDDFISPDYCSYLFKLMQQYNADIVECNHIDVEEDNFDETSIFSDVNSYDNIQVLTPIKALERLHGIDFPECLRAVIACNKLYKASLFKNIRFPIGKLHEDEFTTYKLVFNCSKYIISDKILYAYLQRSYSITKQSFTPRRLDALEAYDSYINFFVSHNLDYLVMRTCIRYLRLIVRLYRQLSISDISDKKLFFDLLDSKLEYVYSWLNTFQLSVEDKKVVDEFITELQDWRKDK